MDLTKRESSLQKKKDKKKKHDRSRSEEKKKKRSYDRDGSRQRKKKDKDKKHHKDRSRSKQREKDKQRRDKDRERPREAEKDIEKPVEPSRDKERQKSRDKDKGRQKDRERDRQREKDRERDRQRGKERQRSRDKKNHKDRRDRSRSKKDQRRRSNDRFKKEYNREDKYERWRRQKDGYRFDSPPKSGDESQRSQDFDNMDRLNKMKAEKQLVSSKADRKLYLGNLPPNITSAQLMQMLNSALKKMEINTDIEGDSIVSAWVSPDGVGHYAFVEFRTAQQATAGLALNGASLYGYQLKLGRPKQYIEYHKQLLSEFGSDGNIDTILRKVEAMGGFGQHLVVQERLVHPPSKVVMLKHIVTIEELAIDEEYKEIVQDVTDMAKRHGDVIKVVIPRPMEIDLEEVKKRVKGLGYIFIKYRTVEQAKYARKQFIKQMFSDRSVACSYFSQKRFDQGELDPIQKIVIDF